jgi:hypothetical protein
MFIRAMGDQAMDKSDIREVRRFKFRSDPYYFYYSPGMAIQAHDHNYILRLVSDRVATQKPREFSLLPQFRGLDVR